MDEKRKEELRQIAMLMERRLIDSVVPHLAEAFIAVIAEAVQEQNSLRTTLSARHVELVLSFRKMLTEHLSTHRQSSYFKTCPKGVFFVPDANYQVFTIWHIVKRKK